MNMKRFFLYFIVIAALALAGCGGGGGGVTTGPVDPPPPPGPTPEETALKEAQDAAMAAYTAAMEAVGGAVDPVAMQNAQMYADMAKEASDSAQAATTSADAMGYQTAAETASANAMDAAGAPGLGLITLSNKLLNGDDIKNAELDGPPSAVPDPINNAKNVSAAIAAAGTADTPDTPDGFTNQGGKSGGTNNTDAQLTISADGTNAVAVHQAGGTQFEVQIGTTDLKPGEMPSRFYTKGGWEAQDLLLVDGDGTSELKTHLVISTDIKADVVKDTYRAANDANTLDADALIADLPDNPKITGDGDVPNDGSDFTALYNADPEDNNAPVPGMFDCPANTACAISVKDGVVEGITGYIFRPRVSVGTARESDPDYLAWGMWVQASTRDDATSASNPDLDAQVGAFAYGSMPFAVPAVLAGKATYDGVANGLYAAGGMVQYFDADATLEADFGGATNTGGRISGSISNIMAAGQAIDGSLNLERTAIRADGRFGIAVTTTPATTAGTVDGVLGGNGFRGSWGGQLFGPAAKTGAEATTFPTTAAGTFSASTQDDKMSLIGAFGSWKAE